MDVTTLFSAPSSNERLQSPTARQSTSASDEVFSEIDQHRGSHHQNKTTPTTSAAFVTSRPTTQHLLVDLSTAQQLRQTQNGRGIMTSRAESFYSAAAVLTIGGIFVAVTMTASLALFVFWRKTNTVFVLQKCEQRDYAEDDDDDEDSMVDLNGQGYDPDDPRLTESDSDGCAGAPRLVVVKNKASKSSRTSRKRWLPVRSYDTDDVGWRRQTEMTSSSSSRMSYDDRVAAETRLSMTSSVSNDAIASGVLQLMEDEDETWRVSEDSMIAVAETRFSHDIRAGSIV